MTGETPVPPPSDDDLCKAVLKTGHTFPREEHRCARLDGHTGRHLCGTCLGSWVS